MEQLPGLVSHHSAAIGLSDITILIPDLRQKVTGRAAPGLAWGDALSVEAGLAGRAFRHVGRRWERGETAVLPIAVQR